MTYEVRFDLVLREDGRKVMDASKARALRAVEEGGSLMEVAKRLRTTPGRLRLRLEGLKDVEGRPLVEVHEGTASLTPDGRRLLDAFEHHSRSIEEQMEHRFRNPLLTVDGIVLMGGKLVVVRRGRDPFRGKLALPGGIVEYGETVEAAVVREVREETGLETRVRRLLSIYSRPDRDPRGHFASVAFVLEAIGGRLRAGDDAAEVELVSLAPMPELAFDHSSIVLDFLASEKR